MFRVAQDGWAYFWSNKDQNSQGFSIPSISYNPGNDSHQLLINKQIKKVKQVYSDLIWSIPRAVKKSVMDHANQETAMMVGAGVVGYYVFDLLTSNIPLLGSTIKTAEYVVGIYCLYHLAQKMRAEQKAAFEQELANLGKVFNWCVKNGAAVSSDETFLRACKALAPYWRTEKFMLWPSNEMDVKYKELLTAPPHNQVFQNVKPVAHHRFSFLGYPVPEQLIPISDSTMDTGSRIMADIRRWGYGPA